MELRSPPPVRRLTPGAHVTVRPSQPAPSPLRDASSARETLQRHQAGGFAVPHLQRAPVVDDRPDGRRAGVGRIWPQAGGQVRLAADPQGRGARPDRPLGLRQDDPPALAEPPHRADAGGHHERQDHARRRRHRDARADGAAPSRHDGLPAAEPVPDERVRQRCLRPARAGVQATAARVADGSRGGRTGARGAPRGGRRTTSITRRCASPAASSSDSASPGRSPRTPRCSCSTSPARRSTRSRRT